MAECLLGHSVHWKGVFFSSKVAGLTVGKNPGPALRAEGTAQGRWPEDPGEHSAARRQS